MPKVKDISQKLFNHVMPKSSTKNSLWLIFERVFTLLVGLFVTAFVARYFGPELYGQFHYALAFVALFTAISTLGLETLTVKALVEKKYEEGTILYTSLFLRIIGGILLTAIAYGIILLLEPSDGMLHVLVLIASFVMIARSLDVIDYYMQSKLRSRISSTIRMAVYLITSTLKLLLVFNEGSLIQYAWIYLIDVSLVGFALIISYVMIKKDKRPWKLSLTYSKDVLSKSVFLILSGLMITIYMRIDQVMIGRLISNRSELGYYSVAVKIAEMWYFVPLAIITSYQPLIMGMRHKDEIKYYEMLKKLFTIVLWVSIIFGVFITIFSPLIILILYGSAFAPSAPILMISVWAGTFAILGSARSVWLVTENLNKYTMIFTIFGAITNIGLNIFFIPMMGGIGAAIATLISQIVVAIIVPLFYQETKPITYLMLKSIYIGKLFKDEGDVS